MEEITLNASRENELAVFDERVNALIESKYILADKRIASLLKGIVSGSYLMSVVEESLKTFSYATEFARNRLLVSDGDGVKARMTLPVDKVRLFTFVFCLISAIKKAVSGEGNELLDGFCAGLSLLVMLAGLVYLV